MKNIASITITAISIIAITYAASMLQTSPVTIGTVKNIHGIPYPSYSNGIIIEEHLAHIDAYLPGPVFAKNIVVTVSFDPQDIEALHIGVRENPFWLSYRKHTIYKKGPDTKTGTQTASVTIPLTDKLQNPNRSIDIMLFADTSDSAAAPDMGLQDSTRWKLYSTELSLTHARPTWQETKEYIKSVMYKERAL